MRRFFRSADGSVSIYLTLLILPIFIFNAVLIDFARVKAAEKQTELAVKAANRSMLAAYDSELQKYGLYGVKLSADSAASYNEVIKNNLNDKEDAESFRFIDTHLEKENSVDVKSIYDLGNQQVFKQQILEEMKYRAPIEVVLDLFDKLLKDEVKSSADESQKIASSADDLEKILKQRDDALQDIVKMEQDIARYRVKSIGDKLVGDLGLHDVANVEFGDNINSLNDIFLQYYIKPSQDMTKETFEKDLQKYNDNSDKLLDQIQKPANISVNQIILTDLENKFKLVVDKNNEIDQFFKNHPIKSDPTMKSDINSYLLSDAQIASLKEAKTKQLEDYKKFDINLKDMITLKLYHHEKEISSSNFAAVRNQIENIQTTFASFADNLRSSVETSAQTMWNDSNKKLNDKKQKAKRDAEKELDSKITDPEYKKKTKKEQQNPEQIKANVENYKRYQSNYDKLVKMEEDKGNKPEDYETDSKGAAKSMDMLQGVLKKLEGLRNDVYINEYTLVKFNYHTLEYEKNKSFDLAKASEHDNIGKEEAEYVLYGLNTAGLNYAAAYSEIYVIRLALRFIEGLTKAPDPEPISRVIFAITYAAGMAWYDTYQITSGSEDVPLIPMTGLEKITFNYKDYLRLFLIMHSKEENKLARIQALVELNTGTTLAEHAYAIQGTTASSVRLWFLPSVMKMLSVTGALNGKVKGNRYYYTPKSMMSSY